MNRTTVALLAALEAVIVAAVGLGIALVPLTILWAAQYHLAVDWFIFWRAAGDIWLRRARCQPHRSPSTR